MEYTGKEGAEVALREGAQEAIEDIVSKPIQHGIAIAAGQEAGDNYDGTYDNIHTQPPIDPTPTQQNPTIVEPTPTPTPPQPTPTPTGATPVPTSTKSQGTTPVPRSTQSQGTTPVPTSTQSQGTTPTTGSTPSPTTSQTQAPTPTPTPSSSQEPTPSPTSTQSQGTTPTSTQPQGTTPPIRDIIEDIIPSGTGSEDTKVSISEELAGATAGLDEIIDMTSSVNIPTSSNPIKSTVSKDNNMIPLMAGLGAAALAGLGTKAYLDRKENKDNEEEIEAEEWQEDEELSLENENYDLGMEESDYLTPDDEFAYQPDGIVAAVGDDEEDEDKYEAVNSSDLAEFN